MSSEHSAAPRYVWWLALAAGLGYLLYQLGPILAPFLLGGILAYVCQPWVTWLCSKRVSRTLAVLIVLLLVIGLMVALTLIIVPLFYKQFSLLAERIPAYLSTLQSHVGPLLHRLGLDFRLDIDSLRTVVSENWGSVNGILSHLFNSLRLGGAALLHFAVHVALVPVVLFYLLRDWNVMLRHLEELLPQRYQAFVLQLAGEIDQVLGEFLRGQLAVMLIMASYYSLALWFTGIDFALPIGIVTGLAVFIPYIGISIGVGLALLVGIMQFSSFTEMIPVAVIFAVGQMLEGYVVVPRLVGERIGLHPLAVIFALLAFGQLFGFFGVLLALPASAALLVGLRHLRRHYLASSLHQR